MDFENLINKINFSGTEKQIAWARDILLSGSEAFASRRKTNVVPADHDLVESVISDVEKRFCAFLHKMESGAFPASRVIDSRSYFDFSGICHMIDEAVFVAKSKKRGE